MFFQQTVIQCYCVNVCSAGIGRTGVFIVLDSMLDQAKAEGKVDIWNFVQGMRDRRMKMIQTSVNKHSQIKRIYITYWYLSACKLIY